MKDLTARSAELRQVPDGVRCALEQLTSTMFASARHETLNSPRLRQSRVVPMSRSCKISPPGSAERPRMMAGVGGQQ